MTQNKKKKFISDIWICGTLNGMDVIGRTYISEGKKLVNIVSQFATNKVVLFSEITEIKKLTITTLRVNSQLIDKLKKQKPKLSAKDKLITDAMVPHLAN